MRKYNNIYNKNFKGKEFQTHHLNNPEVLILNQTNLVGPDWLILWQQVLYGVLLGVP